MKINDLLVKWFNLFRVKNPKIAAGLQVVLGIIAYQFTANEIVSTPEWLLSILSYVNITDFNLNYVIATTLATFVASISTSLTERVKALNKAK